MTDQEHSVAKALCEATFPTEIAPGDVREIPVLNLDPDFDDTPIDDLGTDDNSPFHQGHILALARAAIAAIEAPR